VRRYLKWRGFDVRYVQNFTDIDDKILNRARQEGTTMEAVSERFIKAYFEDMTRLNVMEADEYPRATHTINGIQRLIHELEHQGFAYPSDGDVYYSVRKFKEYGKLSGQKLDDRQVGASGRVSEEDAQKQDPIDFALWKSAKPGEPAWDSEWGKGRPGWHIECSAMVRDRLGDTIDIHAGGNDLIFPHHENEIAQSETAYGAPLSRVWLHNGFLDMAGEKMSKSLGNVVLARDLLEEWPGEVLRWALLSAHYRAPLDWTRALLEQSKAALDRLYGALRRLEAAVCKPASNDGDAVDFAGTANTPKSTANPAANGAAPPPAFVDALCDDLNTPQAMAVLFALATEANKTTDAREMKRLQGELRAAGALMGVLQGDPEAWFRTGDDVAEIDRLVAERVAARQAKNWAEADRLRAVLAGRGVEVMDNPSGSTWKRSG
jgi:cysteinyl-tRNA synthetase